VKNWLPPLAIRALSLSDGDCLCPAFYIQLGIDIADIALYSGKGYD
jgi:hypothetical protein